MPSFISGGNGVSVSSTETSIFIPKEVSAIQFTNTGTTEVIISLGGSGRFSLNIPPNNATKAVDLNDVLLLKAVQGKRFDWGSEGFGGVFTHRTASGTSTLNFEFQTISDASL